VTDSMKASWMDFVLADKMGDMLALQLKILLRLRMDAMKADHLVHWTDELMVLWMARRKEMVTAQVKEILKANMKGCHLAGRMGMQMDRQKTLLMAHQKAE
jgi:hypothetical protein